METVSPTNKLHTMAYEKPQVKGADCKHILVCNAKKVSAAKGVSVLVPAACCCRLLMRSVVAGDHEQSQGHIQMDVVLQTIQVCAYVLIYGLNFQKNTAKWYRKEKSYTLGAGCR